MNDLLSRSFSGGRVADVEIANATASEGTNLEKFFGDVAEIKEELKCLETLRNHLLESNEQSKNIYNITAIKSLRSKMDNEVTSSLKQAKLIRNRLEDVDRSSEANRKLSGCGPGSSTDRTRVSVVNGLRKQLESSMRSFTDLRQKMASEHRETIQRRYFTVTGESPDESTVDSLISTGESETFLQKAIREQGRGQVMETILEIQERNNAVTEMETHLKELHQVFMDMAVLVESQGEQLDDIESHVKRANSFVRGGREQLQVAWKTQLNSRRWSCFTILLLLIIIVVIVLSIRPWK